MSSPFFLDIDRTEHRCTFRLSWGKGQRITVKLPFPATLISLYCNWKESYRQFYRSDLRARVDQSGAGVLPPIDWRTRLVQAEAALLAEFHYWLSDAALLPIRSEIAKAAADLSDPIDVDVFLTCNQIELTRLPWETWELRSEFAATKTIRIARTPASIRETVSHPKHRKKFRILAILGDETGLNFELDRKAVKSLAPLADVEFVGWRPGKTRNELMTEICQAIADEDGWDILFFAGHSNETELTGGDLGIAPNESILVQEIETQLATARKRGLKFAIFNSCSGLSIADRLIDLGLSQVAIMREPIHNLVAQEFLLGFVQGLAAYRDVHESLLLACQKLKLDKNLTYPSAYLIPSLFRHPEAALFRPEPIGKWQWLQAWLPQSRLQAIALGSLLVLSLIPDVQNLLLEPRLWLQANYRQLTGQLPANTPPPVLLVQIDEASIQENGLEARKINPLDRVYLARLLDRVQQFQPKVIGIDYILDYPTPEDREFQRSLRQAVAQQTWLVFATEEKGSGETGITPTITAPNQVLKGYTNALLGYVELPANAQSCMQKCPFAYLLAMAQVLNQPPHSPPQPPAASGQDFRTEVTNYWQKTFPPGSSVNFLQSLHLSPITAVSQWLAQEWLHPIQDFSIPPHQVYQRISAYQLLNGSFSPTNLPSGSQFPIVLIAPGGYTLAGVNKAGEDNFAIPLAIAHWRQQQTDALAQSYFTGGEALSYMVHHFLNRRLVVPIPDFWMVALAAIAGKATVLILKRKHRTRVEVGCFMMATGAYGLVCLQLLITPGVVLPWLLPSVMFWVYTLPIMRKKGHASS